MTAGAEIVTGLFGLVQLRRIVVVGIFRSRLRVAERVTFGIAGGAEFVDAPVVSRPRRSRVVIAETAVTTCERRCVRARGDVEGALRDRARTEHEEAALAVRLLRSRTEFAVGLRDGRAMRVAAPHRDVAFAVAGGEAQNAVQVGGLAIHAVVRIGRVGARQFGAFEITLQQDVDDACDRVRTVHGGRTAGHDFDMIDHGRRDRIQIDRAGDAGRHIALAIDQHEGAVRAQAAQRYLRRAVGGDVEAGVHSTDVLRKLVQQLFGVDGALQLDFLATDDGNGRGRIQAGLRNARTRDHHGFDGLVLRHCRSGKAQGCGGCCSEEQRRAQAMLVLIGFIHLGTPLVRS